TWTQPFKSFVRAPLLRTACQWREPLCLSEPFGADERREEVNDDGGGDRDGDVGHWGHSQMCSQAIVNARQTPILPSPRTNIAGSQTNRSTTASYLPLGRWPLGSGSFGKRKT